MITEAKLMLPQDKANHMDYGVAIFVVAFVVACWLTTPGKAADAAILIALSIGAAKEVLWDAGLNYLQRRRGQVPTHDASVWDFLATSGGAVMPYVAVLVALGMLRP